jgi:hypothetical protein
MLLNSRIVTRELTHYLLLRDKGLLLVISEEGDLAVVRAASDQFTQLVHFPAL